MSIVSDTSDKPKEDAKSEQHAIKRLSNVLSRNGLSLSEGTLVLTQESINLINAHAASERISPKAADDKSKQAEDSETLPSKKSTTNEKTMVALSIPLGSIQSMTYEMALGKPSLLLKWNDDRKSFGKARTTQFIQKEAENKEDRLVNWIPIIDEMKLSTSSAVEQAHEQIESAPQSEQLESEILGVLSEREWKGPFQIVTEMRDRYGSKRDFDRVEIACRQLVKKKLVEEDKAGEFFRKARRT